MAKKDKRIDYRALDVEELDRELGKNRQDLFKLQFRSASAPIKNVMKQRHLKKQVARILTFIAQKKRSEANDRRVKA